MLTRHKPGTFAVFPPCLPSGRWASGHLTPWPGITTLLPDKWRELTKLPSHVDTPYVIHDVRALVCPPRPSSKRTGTLGQTFPPKGFVYGTRPVYITQDSGRANVCLKQTFVAGHLLGRSPSSRSSGCSGYFPTTASRRWAVPGPDVRTRTRKSPSTESVSTCEPSFGLAYLVGAREPCG